MTEPRAYRLRTITRCRIAGKLLPVGAVFECNPGKLRAAASLVACKTAVPADAYTRRDIELFQLLQRALPPA